MPPRTIIYTGKGGVGKSSVALATARCCAREGLRTLVVSTDPAHTLADALEREVGSRPTPCGRRLYAQQVQAQEEIERRWDAVQSWLTKLLSERGVDRIAAEELTVPPGMDELFALLAIKEHYERGDFECLIVDCAPTGETLRLLSFPDVAAWWLEKVIPLERKLVAAARPLARTLLDVPLPDDPVFDEVERLVRGLGGLATILRERRTTSVRLVLNPERIVVREAMRTYTYLSLYGFPVDAIVVNRVLPPEADDGYLAPWRELQNRQMELVREAFAPLPILVAPMFAEEVVGTRMLDRLAAALFGEAHAHEILYDGARHEFKEDPDGARLTLPLPLATRDEIKLSKVGLELVVRVGAHKRTVLLPDSLAGCAPTGARFEDGVLEVSFRRPRSSLVATP